MSKWVTTTLGESCHIYQPKTISTKEMIENGPYPVYGANGVIGRYDKFNHEEPQLLVTCRGATCGAVNVSDPFSWITGNAMVIRPLTSSIDTKFLEYLFRGGIDISKSITGAAQPQITRTNLAPLAFQHPESVEEQRHIVTLLDEAFADIATAKVNAEKNLQNARDLLDQAIQDDLQNAVEKYGTITLGKVCTFENGDRGKNYPGKQHRVEKGIPFINAGHLTPNGLDFNEMDYISPERFALLGNGKIKPNDVLFCLRGSLGKFSCVGNLAQGAIASSLVILRPTQDLNLNYLLMYLSSRQCNDQIESLKGGAAQPNLGAKDLKQFAIPLPATTIQIEMANRLSDLKVLAPIQY